MKKQHILSLALLLAACGGDDGAPAAPVAVAPTPTPTPTPVPTVSSVEFSVEKIEAKADLDRYEFGFSVSPAGADTTGLSLTSSDEAVFTIEDGNVVPHGVGNAELRATVNGNSVGTLPVEVRPFRLYSIGNSLTRDFRPMSDFVTLAQANGITIENDWHVACGQPLAVMVVKPDYTCIASNYGGYEPALAAQDYDAVMLEPWCAKPAEELAAIRWFIDYIRKSKSADAEIFLYITWPENTSTNRASFRYTAAWEEPVFNDQVKSCMNREFLRYLQRELGDSVRYIHAGHVFDDVHRNAASISGVKGAGTFYKDSWHMNSAGAYAAAVSVLYGLFDRVDVTETPGYTFKGDPDIALNAAAKAEVAKYAARRQGS